MYVCMGVKEARLRGAKLPDTLVKQNILTDMVVTCYAASVPSDPLSSGFKQQIGRRGTVNNISRFSFLITF